MYDLQLIKNKFPNFKFINISQSCNNAGKLTFLTNRLMSKPKWILILMANGQNRVLFDALANHSGSRSDIIFFHKDNFTKTCRDDGPNYAQVINKLVKLSVGNETCVICCTKRDPKKMHSTCMECGETICSKCGDKLTDIVGAKRVMNCPFCKNKSVTNIVLAVSK